MPRIITIALIALTSSRALVASGDDVRRVPLSPAEALAAFVTADDVRIELAAAEPDVVDPVEIRFDEYGRMWVVELRDYPQGPAAGQPPESRIRVLEDRDGDGRYETAHTVAKALPMPTGIQLWRGGLIITLAGRVAYLPDVDQYLESPAGASDLETWLEGFTAQNEQLRANHPRLAPDGYIYIANGLRGGEVFDRREGGLPEPLTLGSRDLRFHPFAPGIELCSGPGQFGQTFDLFGRRFLCSNRNPLMHVVLDERYLARNPQATIPATLHDVSPPAERSRVYPLTSAWTTSNLHAHQFTAACGLHLYSGFALPARFNGAAFVCEPTGNLVRCELMEPDGATFRSQPERDGVEWLASHDEWFRPVNIATGPGGALYIVDMHRAVIEHPDFMPEELRTRRDLLFGRDAGRIYRVVARPSPGCNRLQVFSQDGREVLESSITAMLSFPSGWHLQTAFRLLYERKTLDSPEQLVAAAQELPVTVARARALWLLSALGKIDEATALAALADPDPRVQEVAVQVAEPLLAGSSALRAALIELAAAESPRLRFQVALALGGLGGDEVVSALHGIVRRDVGDVWLRRAVATARPELVAPLAARVVEEVLATADATSAELALVGELAEQVASGADAAATNRLLASIAAGAPDIASSYLQSQTLALAAVARGLRRSGSSLVKRQAALRESGADFVESLEHIISQAAETAADENAPSERRQTAIELLTHATLETGGRVLLQLALGDAPVALRRRAMAALSPFAQVEVATTLIEHFDAQTPALRRAILDVLLLRASGCAHLLDAIESGEIPASEIDPLRADRLRKHRDEEIRGRAFELLARATAAQRAEVVASYRDCLQLPADPLRGRELFRRQCAACHRVAGIGVDVAPDISDSRVKKPEQLLTDILDPNRAIDANYTSYTVVTVDGRALVGVLAAETAASVTLRQAEGKQVVLLREEIDELRAGGVSLMPEGLERELSPQAMADLIAFVKHWRYLDGNIPLDEAATPGAQR